MKTGRAAKEEASQGNGGVGEAGGDSDPHAGNRAGKVREGGAPGWDIWGWHLAATLCVETASPLTALFLGRQ